MYTWVGDFASFPVILFLGLKKKNSILVGLISLFYPSNFCCLSYLASCISISSYSCWFYMHEMYAWKLIFILANVINTFLFLFHAWIILHIGFDIFCIHRACSLLYVSWSIVCWCFISFFYFSSHFLGPVFHPNPSRYVVVVCRKGCFMNILKLSS